jgi:phage tail sheath gpL-like
VTAAAAANVVTVTFAHKGDVGNQYDMRVNYQDGEATPAGVTVAIVAMTGGTTNPGLTTLIAAMGDIWYQLIAHPYTDATSLTAIEGELLRRDGPTVMADGAAITAKSDTFANMGTLGLTRNSPYTLILDCNSSPTPAMEYAAAGTAVAALYGNIDPARPFQTLPLSGVLAPLNQRAARSRSATRSFTTASHDKGGWSASAVRAPDYDVSSRRRRAPRIRRIWI